MALATASSCWLFDVRQKHAQDGAVCKREQQSVLISLLGAGTCWNGCEVSDKVLPSPLEPGDLSHWIWPVTLCTPTLHCQICLHVEVEGGVRDFQPDGRSRDKAKVVDGNKLELCFKLDHTTANRRRPAVRYTVCRTTTLSSGVLVDEGQASVRLTLLPKPQKPSDPGPQPLASLLPVVETGFEASAQALPELALDQGPWALPDIGDVNSEELRRIAASAGAL